MLWKKVQNVVVVCGEMVNSTSSTRLNNPGGSSAAVAAASILMGQDSDASSSSSRQPERTGTGAVARRFQRQSSQNLD